MFVAAKLRLGATTVEQYPGGYAGRAAEIEAGSRWFRGRARWRTSARLPGASTTRGRALADEAWDVTTIDVGGRERPLAELPARRWQELEVHVVDLGVGVTFRSWPDDFVNTWLPRLRASLPHRLEEGTHAPAPGTLDEREELAWLYGRFERADLPVLAPWG